MISDTIQHAAGELDSDGVRKIYCAKIERAFLDWQLLDAPGLIDGGRIDFARVEEFQAARPGRIIIGDMRTVDQVRVLDRYLRAGAVWRGRAMKPYYQDEAVTICHGDCREILPTLPKVDLVLTDPLYQIKDWNA